MKLKSLFSEHINVLQEATEQALAATSFDGLIISAGTPFTYFADDRDAPFVPTPHFAHWCPGSGPHHLLHIRPGVKPHLIHYAPTDFWYEHATVGNAFWSGEFTLSEVAKREEITKLLGTPKNHAFIGPEADWAKEYGLTPNPDKLTARLDWQRGIKSPYEVQCLSGANEMAARGHRAARIAFIGGGSELEIHHAYVQAVGCTDQDLPYNTIVGLDAKSAVLHYQNKRTVKSGGVLLIDAGARLYHYGSDITRTYAKTRVHEVFRGLLKAMEEMQQALCTLVMEGVSYLHLHDQSHQQIARILLEHNILQNCSVESAIQKGLTRAFFPHGLGHMLGIQVHDVSGKQRNAEGDACPPSDKYPTLRTVRSLREHEVITMEPGLYFIEVLLAPHREDAEHFNWKLIDELMPWGGIRIEDDLLVEKKSCRNLTREFLQNEFLC